MKADPVIGLVGLGTMGLGIAQVYAQAGFHVVATDSSDTIRAQAQGRLHDMLAARVKSGKLSQDTQTAIVSRFTSVPDLSGLAGSDLVIEAIIEKLPAKQSLFQALEKIVKSDTILATNTSSLPVAEIAEGLQHPERVIGLHFFNPAPVMKLVELVPWEKTDTITRHKAFEWTKACGKTVIACKDRPGFIVNRCARPFYGEALAMLEEGRSASEIDAAMLSAGYKIGPLSLIDLVGADINLAATQSLAQAMHNHPRYAVFDCLKSQVAQGALGRKTGKGFLFPDQPGTPPPDAARIVERIQAVLVNEACTLLEEGGLNASDLDQAMKLGLNFPQGPFEAAQRIGIDKIRSILQDCADKAKPSLHGRYAISPLLQAMR